MQRIKDYLIEIEKEKNVTILFACETGSRAWGFPSPNSDYDIRLIYVHNLDWYLSLNERKDSIDMMLDDNEIDISGWELRKTLRLLWKSNPALLERIQSPIIYKQNEEFLFEINELANHCYSRIATIHHYLSMAKKFHFEINIEGGFNLKKFFYGLRSSVACKWIMEKEKQPPILFTEMLKNISIDDSILNRIHYLIALKATVNEDYIHSNKEEEILDFMQSINDYAESISHTLPSNRGNMQNMNSLFRKYIK